MYRFLRDLTFVTVLAVEYSRLKDTIEKVVTYTFVLHSNFKPKKNSFLTKLS